MESSRVTEDATTCIGVYENRGLIRSTPLQYISKARRNDPTELEVFGNFPELIPQCRRVDVFEMFCFHLSKTPPSTSSPPSSSKTTQSATSALKGVSSLCEYLPGNTPMCRIFLRNWGNICQWMKAVCLSGSKEASLERGSLLLNIFYPALVRDDIAHNVRSKEEMFRLIARLWLDHRDAEPPQARKAAYLLRYMLMDSDRTMDRKIERVSVLLSEAGDDADRVAEQAVRQFVSASRANVLKDVQDFVTVLYVSVLHDKLAPAIMAKNIVPLVTRFLLSITEKPEEAGLFNGDVKVESYIGFLCHAMVERALGLKTLRQAIKHGFLKAAANISIAKKGYIPGIYDILQKLLADIIPRYLVHPSFVNDILASHKELDLGPMYRYIALSPLQKEWELLHKVMLERMVFNQMFSIAEATGTRAVKCENCTVACDRHLLMKCAGCKTAMYCSKECQTMDWKHKHKLVCKLIQTSTRDVAIDEKSMENAKFRRRIFKLAGGDVLRHFYAVKKMVAKKHPRVPLHDLVLVVNYVNVPTALGVQTMDSLRREIPAGTSQRMAMDGYVKDVREAEGKRLLLKIVLQDGVQSVMLLHVIGCEKVEHETRYPASEAEKMVIQKKRLACVDEDTQQPLEYLKDPVDVFTDRMWLSLSDVFSQDDPAAYNTEKFEKQPHCLPSFEEFHRMLQAGEIAVPAELMESILQQRRANAAR